MPTGELIVLITDENNNAETFRADMGESMADVLLGEAETYGQDPAEYVLEAMDGYLRQQVFGDGQ